MGGKGQKGCEGGSKKRLGEKAGKREIKKVLVQIKERMKEKEFQI